MHEHAWRIEIWCPECRLTLEETEAKAWAKAQAKPALKKSKARFRPKKRGKRGRGK